MNLDYQRDAVYAAEEAAHEELWLDDDLHVDDLTDFAVSALRAVGYDHERPTFELDLATDDYYNRGGYYDAATDVIHLHPKLITKRIVLHELAHSLRAHDRHGPQFTAVHLSLVEAVLGDDVADVVATLYRDHGVEVDESWLLVGDAA